MLLAVVHFFARSPNSVQKRHGGNSEHSRAEHSGLKGGKSEHTSFPLCDSLTPVSHSGVSLPFRVWHASEARTPQERGLHVMAYMSHEQSRAGREPTSLSVLGVRRQTRGDTNVLTQEYSQHPMHVLQKKIPYGGQSTHSEAPGKAHKRVPPPLELLEMPRCLLFRRLFFWASVWMDTASLGG